MSLDINVYTKYLSDDLIPKIVERLNDYEMVVEVYPNFSFSGQSGFLPFKFRLSNPHLDVLKGKELKSGFELYVNDFVFEGPFASPEIDNNLKECKKVLAFVWHSGDSFELRFAFLTSAILSELTNGVCCYPADDIWYDNKNIVDDAYKEIKQYEKTLKERNIKFHLFSGW
jgi:hypothetical protein